VDEFGKRVGQFPAPGQQLSEYAPSSGVGGAAAKKNSERQNVFSAAYPTRPPGALDFIVNNVLIGGGLPDFSVEGDLLNYKAPDGYIAIVTRIDWYITPQSAAIDPAQLSMRLFVDRSLLQGTDTMGIGQAGFLDGLYIPLKAGAGMTIRLGRGPGVVRYSVSNLRVLRTNGDPSPFAVSANALAASSFKNPGLVASLNGVLYYYTNTLVTPAIYRSSDGSVFTSIGTAPPFAVGYSFFGSFKEYLFLTDGNDFWYSLNGATWVRANNNMMAPFSTGAYLFGSASNYVEFNGRIYARSYGVNGYVYWSDDIGVTWNRFLPIFSDGVGMQYSVFVVLDNVLYMMDTASYRTYTSIDGQNFTLLVVLPTVVGGGGLLVGSNGFWLQSFAGLLWIGSGSSTNRVYSSPDGIVWTRLIYSIGTRTPQDTSTACVNSLMGIVVYSRFDGITPNGTSLFGLARFPAVYDPELQCFAQISGQLIKAKGSIEQTLVNPL